MSGIIGFQIPAFAKSVEWAPLLLSCWVLRHPLGWLSQLVAFWDSETSRLTGKVSCLTGSQPCHYHSLAQGRVEATVWAPSLSTAKASALALVTWVFQRAKLRNMLGFLLLFCFFVFWCGFVLLFKRKYTMDCLDTLNLIQN